MYTKKTRILSERICLGIIIERNDYPIVAIAAGDS